MGGTCQKSSGLLGKGGVVTSSDEPSEVSYVMSFPIAVSIIANFLFFSDSYVNIYRPAIAFQFIIEVDLASKYNNR